MLLPRQSVVLVGEPGNRAGQGGPVGQVEMYADRQTHGTSLRGGRAEGGPIGDHGRAGHNTMGEGLDDAAVTFRVDTEVIGIDNQADHAGHSNAGKPLLQ